MVAENPVAENIRQLLGGDYRVARNKVTLLGKAVDENVYRIEPFRWWQTCDKADDMFC